MRASLHTLVNTMKNLKNDPHVRAGSQRQQNMSDKHLNRAQETDKSHSSRRANKMNSQTPAQGKSTTKYEKRMPGVRVNIAGTQGTTLSGGAKSTSEKHTLLIRNSQLVSAGATSPNCDSGLTTKMSPDHRAQEDKLSKRDAANVSSVGSC